MHATGRDLADVGVRVGPRVPVVTAECEPRAVAKVKPPRVGFVVVAFLVGEGRRRSEERPLRRWSVPPSATRGAGRRGRPPRHESRDFGLLVRLRRLRRLGEVPVVRGDGGDGARPERRGRGVRVRVRAARRVHRPATSAPGRDQARGQRRPPIGTIALRARGEHLLGVARERGFNHGGIPGAGASSSSAGSGGARVAAGDGGEGRALEVEHAPRARLRREECQRRAVAEVEARAERRARAGHRRGYRAREPREPRRVAPRERPPGAEDVDERRGCFRRESRDFGLLVRLRRPRSRLRRRRRRPRDDLEPHPSARVERDGHAHARRVRGQNDGRGEEEHALPRRVMLRGAAEGARVLERRRRKTSGGGAGFELGVPPRHHRVRLPTPRAVARDRVDAFDIAARTLAMDRVRRLALRRLRRERHAAARHVERVRERDDGAGSNRVREPRGNARAARALERLADLVSRRGAKRVAPDERRAKRRRRGDARERTVRDGVGERRRGAPHRENRASRVHARVGAEEQDVRGGEDAVEDVRARRGRDDAPGRTRRRGELGGKRRRGGGVRHSCVFFAARSDTAVGRGRDGKGEDLDPRADVARRRARERLRRARELEAGFERDDARGSRARGGEREAASVARAQGEDE